MQHFPTIPEEEYQVQVVLHPLLVRQLCWDSKEKILDQNTNHFQRKVRGCVATYC